MEASNGRSQQPLAYDLFYMSRLLRADGREDALALLEHWLEDLGDSSPTPAMVAASALYGDTRPALLASWTAPAGVPYAQTLAEMCGAVLASAQGRFDEAQQHLATLASVVRKFAWPRGEASCLVGFAKLALDRGDYARASRLLAAADASVPLKDRPFRDLLGALINDRCTGVLRNVLDPETARITQAEGAALSLKEALDAELIRCGPTTDPVD
jgi:hypothetical protein